MQIDFHYDMTYFAARIAGFDIGEAESIAWAAQYVDDCFFVDTKKIKMPTGSAYSFTNFLTASALGIGEIFYRKHHAVKTKYDDFHRQIWAFFHFPPGNYLAYRKGGGKPLKGHILRQFRGKSEAQVIGQDVFQLPTPDEAKTHDNITDGSELTAQQEDKLTRETFPLITRPNSDLVRALVKDTIAKYQALQSTDVERQMALQMLGVRMHVYADTWAHQDHVGSPDRRFNRVESFGWYQNKGTWNQDLTYSPGGGYKPDSPGGSQKVATGSRTNVMWLGHGPMGNWPDLPWAVYKWKPRWSDSELVRNNPQEFLQAFVNLTFAMKCAKEKMPFRPQFSPGAYRNILGGDNVTAFQNAVNKMYALNFKDRKKPDKRTTIWNEAFSKYGHAKYDSQKATNQLLGIRKGMKGRRYYLLEDFIATRYFQFNYGAKLHYQLIRNELRSQGFRLIFNNHSRKEAMIDDYKVFKSSLDLSKMRRQDQKMLKVREMVSRAIADLFRSTRTETVQLGIQLLASDLTVESTPEKVFGKLVRILTNEKNHESVYQLFSEKTVKARVLKLKKDLEKLVVWVPDSERKKCTGCRKSFTLTRRRHHCRSCGNIFCGNCSSKRARVPARGYHKSVRVCDDCYQQLSANQ